MNDDWDNLRRVAGEMVQGASWRLRNAGTFFILTSVLVGVFTLALLIAAVT